MRWKKYWESRMKMKRDKIVIGSRESKLAVLQSEMVRDYIKEKNPDLEVEILTMKTTGDIILDRTLDKVGGKGLFDKLLLSCLCGICKKKSPRIYGSCIHRGFSYDCHGKSHPREG